MAHRTCLWCRRPVTRLYPDRYYVEADRLFGTWTPWLCSHPCAARWDALYDSMPDLNVDV